MIKSPKERFQESQIRIGQWAQIVSNPIFDEVCDSALLQMQEALYSNDQFVGHNQMAGALQIIRILKTIHEKDQQPQEKAPQGLNYQAGV